VILEDLDVRPNAQGWMRLAGMVGGAAWIAVIEAQRRYGWVDGYRAGAAERERADG
jgi:hypothetical protein